MENSSFEWSDLREAGQDYCYDNNSSILREMFGEDVTRNADKNDIIKLATEHPETRSEYIKAMEEDEGRPYDFPNDPRGIVHWYECTREFAAANQMQLAFSNSQEFDGFVDRLLNTFRNFVENGGGWKLLWNDNETPKSEEACQFLFQGIVIHYCRANGIDITREANIGRGPVDFKISAGHSQRALIEVKLAKNSKFWNGLEKQLPMYLEAEEIEIGKFLVICFNDGDLKKISPLQMRVSKLNNGSRRKIQATSVNARYRPPSASKL